MLRTKSPSTLAVLALLWAFTSQASAEPLRVTGGFIQVGGILADWRITTDGGIGFEGERESSLPAPIFLSGVPGATVELSATYEDPASSFTIFNPGAVSAFAREEFDFIGGDVTIPSVAEALVSGALRSAPFTFTGSFTFFNSFADAFANVNPIGRQDLFGSGTATARFLVQRSNVGVPLTAEPLVAFSIVYEFEDEAPVPEPATLLLLSGGLGVLLSRRRMRE